MDNYENGFVLNFAKCLECGFLLDVSYCLNMGLEIQTASLKEDIVQAVESAHDKYKPYCEARKLQIGYSNMLTEKV